MEGTIYSIIPAIIMLVLVLLTRKVVLSLGAGIIAGALLIHNFSIGGTLKEIWIIFFQIFITDGSVNISNILLLIFLFLLVLMTAFFTGSRVRSGCCVWMS